MLTFALAALACAVIALALVVWTLVGSINRLAENEEAAGGTWSPRHLGSR